MSIHIVTLQLPKIKGGKKGKKRKKRKISIYYYGTVSFWIYCPITNKKICVYMYI